jgi:NitT/TauT family transport system substrate-binding protein
MGAPGISSIDDLVGEVVAVSTSNTSMSTLFMRKALNEAGIDPDGDVELRTLPGSGDSMNALITNQVSGAVLGPPFNAIAESRGATVLEDFTARADMAWPTTNVTTLASFAEENEDLTVRFLRAFLDSLDAWADNPEEAKDVLSREADIEDAALLDSQYEFSLGLIKHGEDAVPTTKEQDAALAELTELAKRDPEVRSTDGWNAEDFFDDRYILKALGS